MEEKSPNLEEGYEWRIVCNRLQAELDEANEKLEAERLRQLMKDVVFKHVNEKLDEAKALLKAVHPAVCSMKCPSVKYGPAPWEHSQECEQIAAFLAAQAKT